MTVATATFSLIDLNDAIIAGTEPVNPSVDTLWIDTSKNPYMMKRWNGSVWVEIGELDPNYSDTIGGINKSIDDITSDSVIDYTERKILKDRITKIIGYVIADNATTLPAVSTLDSSGKGEFYTVRKQALNAGIPTPDVTYAAVATHYTNLKTYLESLTPVDVWDLSTTNQSKTIAVTKSTFRDKFLQYDNAVNALVAATAAKQKSNSDTADQKGQSALDDLGLNSEKWSDAANKVGLWKYKGDENKFNGNVIATRTLFATSLLLSDWTNLIENPDFEGDTIGSIPAGFNSTTGVRVADISGFVDGNGSNKALEIDAYNTSNNSIYVSNLIPVKEGEVFFLAAEGRYLNTAGSGTGRLGFLRYDGKKQSLSSWQTPVTWSGTKTTTFTDMSATYTVPAGTGYLQVYATFSNNGETTNKFYIDNLRMRRMANAELIVDGIIEGRHIKALSVQFDKLQGGTATLGGANNVNGQLIVLDANGDLAVGLNTLDDDGVTYYSGFQNVIAESLYISKSIKAPNIVETTTDVINLYVDPVNGNDDNPGTSWAAGPLATIQEAVNRLPKVLSHDVRIQMHYSNASEVSENVLVQGFTGSGTLTIDFQNTSNVLYGNFKFMYSTINTVINSGKFIATANQSPVYAEGIARLAMNNSIVDAKGLTAYAVYISNSFADLRGCQFYNGTNSQVIAAYGARVDVIDCTGSGGINGVRAYRSSIVAGTGTAPTGSSKNALGDQGGQCTGTWTYPVATAPSTPAPATYTTVTVAANSGNSWRWGFGGQWYGGNVRQALWTSSYGRYMGYWFFGTQFNQFNGKTITKVRIWAQRYNGGGSSASKNARFVLHGYQSQPSSSSQPTFYGGLSTGTAYTAGFKWGEAKWIDATAAFKNHINQTSVYGIGLWMYSDSPYMIFNNNLKVEVTYKN